MSGLEFIPYRFFLFGFGILVLSSSSPGYVENSPLYPVSREVFAFVLKLKFCSGVELLFSGDIFSKYGVKLSFSGDILYSPDTEDTLFSIFTVEALFVSFNVYGNAEFLLQVWLYQIDFLGR